MSASPPAAPPEPGGPEAPLERRPRSTWSKVGLVAAVLVVLGLLVMWTLAFIAPKDDGDKIPDRAWAAAAEAVCARARADLAQLPAPKTFATIQPRSEALRRRADVGEQSTARLKVMLAELRALPAPTDATSSMAVTRWLADYDRYVAARDTHVAEWRAGKDEPFKEPALSAGQVQPVSIQMDYFSTINEMKSCEVPQDFG